MIQELYTDGGVCKVNPSPFGGAYAWVLIDDRSQAGQGSGTVRVGEFTGLDRISNNFMELYAAVQALVAMPIGWRGLLWTDSQVTQYRLQGSNRFEGVPSWLQQTVRELRFGRRWTVKLLGGHPTRYELDMGKRDRNGLRVSKWNVLVDAECQRLCAELLANHQQPTR